jgi:hypothetical protein
MVMSMEDARKNRKGSWIAIGAGIGVELFTATQEPVWTRVGVALGAALGFSKTEKIKIRSK